MLNSVLNETANFSEPIPNDTSVAGGTPQPTNVNQGVNLESNLLNKDYSGILQKSIEKSKQKHGV